MKYGPYRESTSSEVLEAMTKRGRARLAVSPTETRLELEDAEARVAVSTSHLSLSMGALEKARRLTLPLSEVHVYVARVFPVGEVALWLDRRGTLSRKLVLEPLRLLDEAALTASRALDRLGDRFGAALASQGAPAHRAVEFGKGGHRVLLAILEDRMVVHARPLFREHLRRRLEVFGDGTAVVVGAGQGGGDRRIRCRSRHDVMIRGDFLCVEDATTQESGQVWLPWISPADRQELATFLGMMFDPHAD